MLGVSRQHVSTLANAKSHGFPAPEAELAGGRIWRREDIEKWMSDNPARVGGRRPICSFCGKGAAQVRWLVQGPKLLDEQGVQTGWVAICDECIDLAALEVVEKSGAPTESLPELRRRLGW